MFVSPSTTRIPVISDNSEGEACTHNTPNTKYNNAISTSAHLKNVKEQHSVVIHRWQSLSSPDRDTSFTGAGIGTFADSESPF